MLASSRRAAVESSNLAAPAGQTAGTETAGMRRTFIRVWSTFLVALLVCAPALTVSAKKKPRRRAVRYTVPSYGNPTENDSLAGENEAVRAVAAQALGRYNGSVVVVEADTGRVLSIVNQELA